MKLVFLGHQSWFVNSKDTNILIDPVLYDGFGSDDDNSIEIYPPREINFDNIPEIDAIILSHEHSDHFHIPTLNKFKRAPIFVGPLMLECVLKTISLNNLNAKVVPFQIPFNIGDLEIILYPSGEETVFWESRVSQILIRPRTDPENSIYIAVDALVSHELKEDIRSEAINLPRAIVVSNNSQITPDGVLGSLDNFKDDPNEGRTQMTGLLILKELLVRYLEDLESINNIIVCGGGFVKKYDTYFGTFLFSDQARLAEIANFLSINKKIFGPTPGKVLLIDEIVDYSPQDIEWIYPKNKRLIEINEAGRKFKESPVKVNIKAVSIDLFLQDEQVIENELSNLAKAFMLSEIGNLAIDFIASKTYYTPPYGLAIKLFTNREFSEMKYYALNLNTAQFKLVKLEEVNEKEIPFGLELFLNDLLGIISAHIQIWDLGGIGIRSWYIGEKSNSPVAFLYSYYGEQIHPDLNFRCFQKRWINRVKKKLKYQRDSQLTQS